MNTWSKEHKGNGWTDKGHRAAPDCDRDEYPPAYYLNDMHPAWIYGGQDTRGQVIRYLPADENRNAGRVLFKRTCFDPPVKALSDRALVDKVQLAPAANRDRIIVNPDKTQTLAVVTVDLRPEFTITAWAHAANPPANDGLWDNKCWPKAIAPNDPGFALLEVDPWYNGRFTPDRVPYNYDKEYVPGKNGV